MGADGREKSRVSSNIDRRSLLIGAGALAIAAEPHSGALLGQSEILHASEVLKNESFIAGLDRLWRDTKETGLEHAAVFIRYKDKKTAWVRIRVTKRLRGTMEGDPI